jgi:hypothetical protein
MTFVLSCVRQDSSIPCNYRIAQEGLAALLPLISAQCFRPTVDEFERIVTERSVPVPHIAPAAVPADAAATGTMSGLSALCSIDQQAPLTFRGVVDEKHTAEEGIEVEQVGSNACPICELWFSAAGGAAINSGSAVPGQPPTEANGPGADAIAAANDASGDAAAGETVEAVGGKQQKKDGKPRAPLLDPTTLEQLEAVQPGCCVAILRSVWQRLRTKQSSRVTCASRGRGCLHSGFSVLSPGRHGFAHVGTFKTHAVANDASMMYHDDGSGYSPYQHPEGPE